MKKYIPPSFIPDCNSLIHEEMISEITVGEFISLLKAFPKNHEMNFSGLDFYRLKKNGNTVQLEFNQRIFKKKNGKIVIQEENN